jgi:signal transduction histidine kinase/ligand-binding sensor domain-containing protein
MTGAHRLGQGPVAISTVIASTLLACCPDALALNRALDVSQYAHTSWKVRDGFVKGTVFSIAQTPDGYLWLGTEFGLVRFDGVSRVVWVPPPGQHLPSSVIFSLLAAHDGTLWIGTSKGLVSWKDGKLMQYPELAGQSIRAQMIEDHEGTVWAGGLAFPPPGKLCAIRKDSVHCFGQDGSLDSGVRGLFEDHDNNLWVALQDGLWRWKPGPRQFYPAQGPGNGIQGLAESDDGALLFGPRDGISRLTGGKIESYPLPKNVPQFTVTRMLRGRDGNLWIGTLDRGLVHVQRDRTDVFARADGLSGDLIEALFIDRESTIWVATDGGLDRFREFAVPTLSLSQGLSNASVLSVLADRDGSVWLSTRRGLNRWNNGQITIFPNKRASGLLNGNYAGSLFQDSRGRIWASTLREFGYLENDRFVAVRNMPGEPVYSITEDNAGNLWVANKDRGLIHLLRDGRVQQTLWVKLGHNDYALALAVDPVQHGLWVGFYEGGIVYFADGQVRANYSTADGLGEGRVNDLRFDPDGSLWVATQGGLSRFKNGRVATLTTKNGLPCDSVHWAMEDNNHSFWLYTTCGLVRIARSELDAWAAAVDKQSNAKPAVHATVFDDSDGVRTIEDPFGYTPPVAKSSDGRLWFLPSDGASAVDPRRLPYNDRLPPVYIEQITADHKIYDIPSGVINGRVRLPPRVRDLKIDYTALSLVATEKVLFRYKLEGWDQDWVEVGNRRQALYSNLPPREYRFRVAACNNSGMWNESGASFNLTIAPAYYQTTWFVLSCIVVFLALLWVSYRLRLRQLAWQFHLRMEERVNERTRIARDLHDTLLQSFQGVLMKLSVFSYRLSDQPETKKELETIVEQARQALTEGRDAVQGLRSSTVLTNEMEQAIRSLGEQLDSELSNNQDGPNSPEFRVHVEGASRELVPMVRDEVYRIAGEAVRNARRHAQARRIEVSIQYGDRHFRMLVRDNGKGIDQNILGEGHRAGHHGLQGMQERAKVVEGKLSLWSNPDSGTEIELTVPAAIAYGKATRRRSMSMVSGRGT